MKGHIVSVKVISFLSLFMLLTLNAESGKDMLDVTVNYIDEKGRELRAQAYDTKVTRGED